MFTLTLALLRFYFFAKARRLPVLPKVKREWKRYDWMIAECRFA